MKMGAIFCLGAWLSISVFAQQVTNPSIRFLSGTAAAASGSCDAAGEVGAFYIQTGNPATVPTRVSVCTQTGASTFAWNPVGWKSQDAAPATCGVGELWFDSNASAGSNLNLCTSANTWTAVTGGGGGTGAAAETISVAYSATPTFTAVSNTATTFTMTLTGNVTGCTLAGMTSGQVVTFRFTQDGTGGRTVACAGLTGLSDLFTTASQVCSQTFSATSSSAAYAVAGMVCPSADELNLAPGAGGTSATFFPGTDTVAGIAATQTLTSKTLTSPDINDGNINVDGGTLEVPNSDTLPGTCTVGQSYMDTNATTGQRWYLCESANTWVVQGAGGSAPYAKAFGASAVTMTGSDVTVYSFDTPELAIGSCMEIRVIFNNAGNTGTWKIFADATQIATPLNNNPTNQYINVGFNYCNDAGVQNTQNMTTFIGTYTTSVAAGSSWLNYFDQAAVRTPTAVDWASAHTLTIKVNGASGAASGYAASVRYYE